MLEKLHWVFNKLIIVSIVALSATALYLVFFKESPSLVKKHSFEQLQEEFLFAVRKYDIKSAKRLYGHLKEKNPYSPFVEDMAPAYMADIYLHYADQLAFNPEAAAMFRAEAKRWAPEHPTFAQSPSTQTSSTNLPAYNEKTTTLSSQVAETEAVAAQEMESYLEELASLEQTLDSMEANQVHAEAHRLETILAESSVKTLPEVNSPPMRTEKRIPSTPTDDACLLSYYTRSTPVSTCTDVLSSHQYGPSLFVIGDDQHNPLAFTQQPITLDAFNALCAETKGCKPERLSPVANAHGLTLDLSDVESTVNHYNSFCEMTHSCSSLNAPSPLAILNPNKLPEYASLLSKQTGYQYRPMTAADVEAISAYFKSCVDKERCEEALGNDISRFLRNEKEVLLVRAME